MTFILTREYGNRLITRGTLTVEGSQFRCKTMELRAPEHSEALNKGIRHAIPCGTYKLGFVCDMIPMTPITPIIRGAGRAVFTQTTRYQDMKRCAISLATSVSDDGVAQTSDHIKEALQDLIYSMRRMEGKPFNAYLIVKEAPDFTYHAEFETNESWAGPLDFVEDDDENG